MRSQDRASDRGPRHPQAVRGVQEPCFPASGTSRRISRASSSFTRRRRRRGAIKYNVPPDDAKSRRGVARATSRRSCPKPGDFQDDDRLPPDRRGHEPVPDAAAAARAWSSICSSPATRSLRRRTRCSGWRWSFRRPSHRGRVCRTRRRARTRFSTRSLSAGARPAPQPGDFRVADGLLDLDPKTFSFVQTDVDGAGLKVMNFARSLLTLRRSSRTPARSGDEAEARDRRAGAAQRRPDARAQPARRHAQERVDVSKTSSTHAAEKIQQRAEPPAAARALCGGSRARLSHRHLGRRVGAAGTRCAGARRRYELDGGAVVSRRPEEEGTVRLAATTSPDPTSNPDIIWLHEALVSWTGLEPLRAAAGPDDRHHRRQGSQRPVTKAEPEVPPGIAVQDRVQALAGLAAAAALRPQYWIRARVVDLAGNSLALQPKDFGRSNRRRTRGRTFATSRSRRPPSRS